ncbi:T9SS-dependent choice-of-anchor J family protein [Flavobacterium sp. NRK1]|uniref:T9SS-dependent choice-of-anchor J family protein n=1 Tax=Flavobacterium sp. NRK1 TaxID=2954929 RepID=UPI0020920560|nr:T9SS type A sorting domain-containing protein [Flavobacterium sp. NRK1]MCO6149358.1 T9SS type A sorting domain-containing protein [Flavobacterium sp. NRK1]
MKKQLLAGAFVLASFFAAQAQTIFSVDFSVADEATLGDWYLIDADGDTDNWGVQTTAVDASTAYGFDGGFAFSASYSDDAGALTPDNMFVTQAFEVPAEGATVSFKVGGLNDEYFAEHYAVYVVTDEFFSAEGNTIADLINGLGEAKIEETLAGPNAVSKNFVISDNVGESVRVVFRHYQSTDELYLVLDDVEVTTGNTAGVNDNTIANLSVFPNPVNNGLVNITADTLVNNITIVDLNGRTVKAVKFNGVSEAQVNVSDLASGVYMMTIASDKGTTTKKIVKN